MKDFIKEYFIWIVLFTIIIISGTYLWFVIFPLFWPKLLAPTGGHDWLTFWGSFLTFGGTVLLGAASVWQNKQYKKQDEDYRVL